MLSVAMMLVSGLQAVIIDVLVSTTM